MNRPCTMCGSTNWPDPDTTCPLCYGPAEAGPDPDDDPDHDSHDDERYDDSENRLIEVQPDPEYVFLPKYAFSPASENNKTSETINQND